MYLEEKKGILRFGTEDVEQWGQSHTLFHYMQIMTYLAIYIKQYIRYAL